MTKIVDIAQLGRDTLSLISEVESGEEIVIEREGIPVARLAAVPRAKPEAESARFERTPGILCNSPAWRDFKYDPSIFKPLETDEELREEGWEV